MKIYFHPGKEEIEMPTHARFATRAADEALDVQIAAERVKQLVRRAMLSTSPGQEQITLEEAGAILMAALQTVEEAQDVVKLAEQVDISELLAVAHLTGQYSPALLKRAQEVGLEPILLSAAKRRHDDDDPLRAA